MKQKNLSWLASAAIILLLVIAGPAQAFNLFLTFDKHNPIRGEIVTFTAGINIKAGERLPIEYLTLTLDGPETQVCKFSPAGEILGVCKGITNIVRITPDYGYGYNNYGYGYGYRSGNHHGYGYTWGYGYGYGYIQGESRELIYEITLDTTNYQVGDYETELMVKILNTEAKERAGQKLKIRNAPVIPSGGGSSDDETCETEWTCTTWGQCVAGYQYRTCTLVNPECTIYPESPETAQTCEIQELSGNNGNNNENNNNGDNGNSNPPVQETSQSSQNQQGQGISRITGAVIGPMGATLGDLFIVILGMVIVIGGLTSLILWRRLTLRKKLNFYTSEFA